jgi:copper chaperone CopZ
MMCGMCESHINDAIRNSFTVKKVKASKRKKEAVIVSEEEIDEKKMKEVIEATGYHFISMEAL